MSVTHTITDNGIGMSEAFQKNLFQPFCQEGRDDCSERRGSGLGLAIVKQLVDLMGGSIHCESKKGQGTRFEVVLDFPAVNRAKEMSNEAKKRLRDVRNLPFFITSTFSYAKTIRSIKRLPGVSLKKKAWWLSWPTMVSGASVSFLTRRLAISMRF